MFRIHAAAMALLIPWSVSAQETAGISSEIANTGLAATEARLSALSSPGPDDSLALGGVRFLRAIERAQQVRWKSGMSGGESAGMMLPPLPVLRLPVPENPDAGDFDPDSITWIFSGLLTDLASASAALNSVTDTDDASLTLNLGDIWFDIDDNGTRDGGEDLLSSLSTVIPFDPDQPVPTIRFDVADAAWASAYSHLLSAVAELVLAFDPATQVSRIQDARRVFDDLGKPSPFGFFVQVEDTDVVDLLAVVYFSLQSQPDALRTASARTHLLNMVSENRTFWRRVEAETDNDSEWIPNDRQSSAIAIEFPPGLGAGWQDVLADFEAMLTGEKLIPHWRLRLGAGLNLRQMFEDPVPVDLAEWFHGAGLLRYAEEGERISPESMAAFQQTALGQGLFFAFVLN